MRLFRLVKNDIAFQYRYGFYLLYAFFTLFYIAILYFIPEVWSAKVGVVILVSDPLLIGLVFMGALILFEKSERVLNSLAVSPISVHQYIMSKAMAIGVIGLVSSLLIMLAHGRVHSVPLFVYGMGMGSVLFSFIGLSLCAKVSTLNGFMIRVVPMIMVATFPLLAYIVEFEHWSLELHPCSSIINLLTGRKGLEGVSVFVLLGWTIVAYVVAKRRIGEMIRSRTTAKI